jgi:predicted nucleotidyltransferase
MKLATIDVQDDAVRDLCVRYRVAELSLFGSALGESFGPDSDVDLLAEFLPGARIGLFELGELKRLVGRDVDLVPKGGLKPLIRESSLEPARVLHAA